MSTEKDVKVRLQVLSVIDGVAHQAAIPVGNVTQSDIDAIKQFYPHDANKDGLYIWFLAHLDGKK